MRKTAAIVTILSILPGLLTGCTKQEAPLTEIPQTVPAEVQETIPAGLEHFTGLDRYADPVDYSDPNNWLSLPQAPEKDVDVIFLYPTVYGTMGETEADMACIDDMSMRIGAALTAATQASVFGESCNLFIPYYRQFTVEALLEMDASYPELMEYCVRQDIYRMLDYYFKYENQGRPFILAGHSQGSLWLTYVLEDYMAKNPEYLQNMVAAYVIGYSVTEDYLARNPHLKFAEGSDDTGVIISYNTEGPENKDQYNCVVREGAIAINPITWKRDDSYAPAAENLGSLNGEGGLGPGIADARIDPDRGVVVCESIEAVPELQSAMAEYFGPEGYHLQDYSLYYGNLQKNVADRIAAFERK
ncbi:MAG: DUF3089 domain-containing protein [Oscillospiraceae bacterium]|nr:DUF3089 domain-containing protein [Oscillospiraceae bacterium]